MATRDLTIAIVGSGGDGVVSMGEMIAQAAASEGVHVIKTESYGPQIRGGESSCTVRLSADPLYSQGDFVDVLVVFGWADFARFRSEIVAGPDAIVLYEESDTTPLESLGFGPATRRIAIPFIDASKQATGGTIGKNIVTLGILAKLFNLPEDALRNAVKAKFAKKKAEVAESNLKAFEAGLAYAETMKQSLGDKAFTHTKSDPHLLMSGNEAVAVGAIHAGCRFFAGYPITPSSEILHYLSEWLPRVGGSVVQTEDELSALGAVVGGSFAGVKSMTATSGPGLSLMSEMLGLSTMAEIPAVIVDVQRGGPSTGNPTRSEQSDLWHALYASHGDAPRVVLAASDVEDCFHTTVDAFNISEEYQIPVILLTDQFIGQRKETLPKASLVHEVKSRTAPTDEEKVAYERYRDTPTGVSPMSTPGTKGGMYQTNGLEHDEHGAPNSMYLLHEKMNEKRFRKLWPIRKNYHFVRKYGPAEAEVGVLCWGSSKGAVEEAVMRANQRGEKVSALVPQMIFPFPKHEFEEYMRGVGRLLIVELNYSAQFYKYLRTFLDFAPGKVHVYKRSGGKHLTVAEVEEEIRKVLEASYTREEVLV
ncbi:MAG: 2-oxoacid:acceptor oxidoreductase subunit alpha [Thermoanaerobaculia bacterium]